MHQNIEKQIQILNNTFDQPMRFCFEFPFDVSLLHYFMNKGQQCLTYRQEVLLNGLLSGNSFLYKVDNGINSSLIQSALLGVVQQVINTKHKTKKRTVLIVSHNIKLFQQFIQNFEEIAAHTDISYVVIDQRPKGQLPKVDVILLLSTYFQVVLQLLKSPVTLCLSTDLIATKANIVLQEHETCQVVGFFTDDNDIESWNSNKPVQIVEIRDIPEQLHYNAFLEKGETLRTWLIRAILDNSDMSISIVCESEQQAQELHAFLLLQGFRSLLLHSKERKYFVDKHIRLLKRRLYDVVLSTEVQKSADIQIVLSSIFVSSQQKTIFVHQNSPDHIKNQIDNKHQTDFINETETLEIQTLHTQDVALQDSEVADDHNHDIEETNEFVDERASYRPPKMEDIRRKKNADVLFRLFKNMGTNNGILYQNLAEEIVEHPQSIQLIATLLQEFDIQSLSYEKFEKIDRSKLESIHTETQEFRPRSKSTYRKRKPRR